MSQIEVKNAIKSTTKRDRFVRIAERRVNGILDGLDNLGKCSNGKNYEYTDKEVLKIFREIERKVKETKLQFQGSVKNSQRFKL